MEAVPPREAAPEAEIPADLEAVCLKSLAKDREERWPTILEMAQALLATQVAAVLMAPEPAPPQRRFLPVLMAVVGIIAVVAIAVWAYAAGRESAPEVAVVAAPDLPDMVDATGTKGQVPTPVVSMVPAPLVPVVADDPPTVGVPVEPVEPGVPVVPVVPVEPVEPVEPVMPVMDDSPKVEPKDTRRPGTRPSLPEQLTAIELSGGMSKLAARVRKECSGLAMRKMAVGLRVEVAASGKVKSASPKGLQSEALGGCVAKIAKTAKYRAARQGSEFEYTFRM